MLTEFGGIAYAPPEDEKSHSVWGYVRSADPSELQIRYTALLQTVNCVELFSGFCYTQLTDTFQEANGLLYADRTPKFPLDAIASATLGRGRMQQERTTLLESVKMAWSQLQDVLPETPQAGWPSAHPVQPQPHCGGEHCS
jgi:hypothetical protein